MRISVVTPSLNQARFLQKCLESVHGQQAGAVEHVVHDGGSNDGSVDMLRRWDGRVRWVSQRDRGQSDAINQGIRSTGGEIIGWLNSDDFYYAGAFDAVLRAFADDATVDAVYGAADYVDLDGRAYQCYPTEPWSHARLAEVCFICQPALFFRRRAVERVGLLNEDLHFCMDYEYWLRFAQAGLEVRHIPQKLAASRMHPANKTMGSRVAHHAEVNRMLRDRLGATPDNWLYAYADAVVAERIPRRKFPRIAGVCMLMASLLAALRWNGRVRMPMLRHVAAVLAKGLRRSR